MKLWYVKISMQLDKIKSMHSYGWRIHHVPLPQHVLLCAVICQSSVTCQQAVSLQCATQSSAYPQLVGIQHALRQSQNALSDNSTEGLHDSTAATKHNMPRPLPWQDVDTLRTACKA
jgi:hypothetical protein